MPDSELIQLLERASETSHGLAVRSTNLLAARRLRRTLYYVRDRAHREGEADFSDLSIVIRPEASGEATELWIVRRNTIPELHTSHKIDAIRPLERNELPEQIKARGTGPSPLRRTFSGD